MGRRNQGFDLNDPYEKQTLENILYFYRDELLQILNGKPAYKVLSSREIKKFRRLGILRFSSWRRGFTVEDWVQEKLKQGLPKLK